VAAGGVIVEGVHLWSVVPGVVGLAADVLLSAIAATLIDAGFRLPG
jgi:hypothetical protein